MTTYHHLNKNRQTKEMAVTVPKLKILLNKRKHKRRDGYCYYLTWCLVMRQMPHNQTLVLLKIPGRRSRRARGGCGQSG